ncbi:GntR family transcriptional regulator [Stackebrandtia soli]|uniref:GntR family transcriptional regulator n=1 Tax=Stackebrandtia soli TaxID=1892856 RepID=UPI0039EB0B3D
MSKEPLYAQVERALAARIIAEMAPGDRLPTEDRIIEEFQVSRITVRRAIANLVARKLAIVVQGKGAFAARPVVDQPLTALTGFVEDMRAIGLEASAVLVSLTEEHAEREVAEALRLPWGATVTRIERTRKAEGRPLSFDRTFVPVDIGRKLAEDDLAEVPIFTLLEEKYGIPLVDADYTLQAAAASETVAAALDCPVGAPVLRITRTTRTVGGRPIDYELLHYRGDAVTFTTRLARPTGEERP